MAEVRQPSTDIMSKDQVSSSDATRDIGQDISHTPKDVLNTKNPKSNTQRTSAGRLKLTVST